jgi:hypothetical protein
MRGIPLKTAQDCSRSNALTIRGSVNQRSGRRAIDADFAA